MNVVGPDLSEILFDVKAYGPSSFSETHFPFEQTNLVRLICLILVWFCLQSANVHLELLNSILKRQFRNIIFFIKKNSKVISKKVIRRMRQKWFK